MPWINGSLSVKKRRNADSYRMAKSLAIGR